MSPANPPQTSKKSVTLLQKALAWHQQDRLQEALGMYQQSLAIDPHNFEALQGLGILYGQLGRFEDALQCITKAVMVQPDDFAIYYNQGVALQELKRHEEALSSYDRALALKPDFTEAHINRGNALKELRRYQEALTNYDKALALEPTSAQAYNNRGAALELLRDYDDALASYERAITLRPDFAKAHNNRGALLEMLHRYDDALASYNQAISLSGNYAEAHYNKGLLKMLLGDYQEGWSLNEWRWKTDQKNFARNFKQPLWLGDHSISGKTILLHAEQGLGDTIQMVRYVPMVEALGGKVILEVPAVLVPLLNSLKGNFTIVTKGHLLPAFDLHCPLMSLPLAFKSSVASIPAPIPYLAADPQRQNTWFERLGPKSKPRVGLAWSGNPQHKNDRYRSMSLRTLEPLLGLDCEYHALQKEVRVEDQPTLAEFTQIHTHEDNLNDFADSAALIAELDLVISVDSSVAHLAGALGKPVGILLPYNADYRWLTVRSDSPWYPTARLFRQRSLGAWEDVIAEVSSRLSRPGDQLGWTNF
jgi:tetratricopeptide (TPR) repeat protein